MLFRLQPADAHALCDDECFEAGVVLFLCPGEEAVGVVGPVADFLKGVFHAEIDDLAGVGAACGEAGEEFGIALRHDEEIDGGGADDFVRTGAYLDGALDVEIHDYIDSEAEVPGDFRLQGAVEVFVDFRAFEKFPGIAFLEEFLAAEEIVVACVDFTVSGRSGAAGDGVVCFSFVREAAAKCRFS